MNLNTIGDHPCCKCGDACDCCQPSECVNCSRCAAIPAPPEAAPTPAQDNKDRHIAALNAVVAEHGEFGGLFQPGGRFYAEANLPLGRSAVVEGGRWLVEQLDLARAALASPVQTCEWRAIETDGYPSDGAQCAVWRAFPGHVSQCKFRDLRMPGPSWEGLYGWVPTHWLLLPAPPSGQPLTVKGHDQ